jgi:RNA polymerase sigma factor (sigma-70 family)
MAYNDFGRDAMSATTQLLDRLPDERLVALVRADRDEAFEAIVRRHRAALLAFARRMLRGSGADPEDVLQDAFIRAHGALRADSRAIALRPWLYMIVRNRALDSLRAPRPARGGFDDALAARPGGLDPCAILERREELRMLTGAMAALPPRQRTALIMHVLDGRSHREVAHELHTSVQATKSLLTRARAHLAQETGLAA